MNCWLFIATTDDNVGALDKYKTRIRQKFWGLGKKKSDGSKKDNREELRAGDRVVFYVGDPEIKFYGTAVLASEHFELTAAEREKYAEGIPHFTSTHGVRLTEIEEWETPVRVHDVIRKLDFFSNKSNWQIHLRGSVKVFPESDLELLEKAAQADPAASTRVNHSAAVWEVLLDCARKESTIQYEALAERFSLPAVYAGRLLEPVQHYCKGEGIPLLNILAHDVNGKRGHGFAGKQEEVAALVKEVYRYYQNDWNKRNPFGRITSGTAKPALTLSERDFEEALDGLYTDGSPIAESGFQMLSAHYYAPGRAASTETLAQACGFEKYHEANLNYGRFAHKLADALGHHPEQWLMTLATVSPQKDAKGYAQWVLRPEVARALENLGHVSRTEETEPVEEDARDLAGGGSEKETKTKRRVGQDEFRRRQFIYWNRSCSVTEFPHRSMLVAAHIKPWAKCSSAHERMDKMNGLLLLPHLDKAFEIGLISFSDEGRILISSRLREAERKILGITEAVKMRRIEAGHHIYLDYHRRTKFKA